MERAFKPTTYAELWRETGPALEESRWAELRAMSDAEILDAMDRLLRLGVAMRPTTPQEWELFERDRESVHFQSLMRRVEAHLRSKASRKDM